MADQTSTAVQADTTVEAEVSNGIKALESGNVADAVMLFARASQRAPHDGRIAHNLGFALLRAKRLPEAEETLKRSLSLQNTSMAWITLAELYETVGQQANAFRSYKQALKIDPSHYIALIKLAALKVAMGDKAGGRDCYRLALDARPRDAHATMMYTNLIFEKEPETAVRLLEEVYAHAGEDLDLRATVLEQLICKKEWAERIKRGEMPYHASRLDELFFNYARPYLEDLDRTQQARLTAQPGNEGLMVAAGLTRFCLNDRHQAERLFRGAPRKTEGRIFDAVRFDPAFYDELRAFTEEDLTRTLVPMLEITQLVPDSRGVLYLSCNFSYFHAFALPMILSLRERSSQTPVHIHIMDADEEETAFAYRFMTRMTPVKFALSVERPGLKNAPQMQARSYYHAVRFIRFYQHLCHYGVPLWIMDVDALVNRSLDSMFERLNEAEVSMRIRPARIEPWNQFSACSLGAQTSGPALEYVRLVAAYLAYFFQRNSLRWGIDQLAMYGVFADMQDRGKAPSLSLLGEPEVDFNYSSDSFVWCNAGADKLRHLKRVSTPPPHPPASSDENMYAKVFERYWNECERIIASLGGRG